MDIEAILRESAAYFDALEEDGFDHSVEFKSEEDDPIADIIHQLADSGNDTFTAWFSQLETLLENSDNLTDFQVKLTDVYPDLGASEFKQAMVDASVLAGMRGYNGAKSNV
jgi:hypothetical protein